MMKKMLLSKSKKLVSISTAILILSIIFQTVIVFADPGDTLVYVNPANQIVAPGANFNITINCAPGQPIKSYELKVSFNATLIGANSVSQGNIFNGHSIFSNNGTINNTAGTIIDIYSLIVGQENVSANGTLINISFTAKSVSGISSINIYDINVTNETTNVPISVTNGSVQIDGIAPEIVDSSPAQGYTGDSYTFSVTVTDNTDPASNLSVYVNWTHGANNGNDTMTHVGSNVFQKTVTLASNSISNINYNFYANDSYGNGNNSGAKTKPVYDNDPPSINSITATPNPQEVDGYVNLSAVVTDNIDVGNVSLNITYPDSSTQNFSITGNVSGNVYYCNQTYAQYGTHYYFIWSNDEYSNSLTSSTYTFFIGDYSPPTISEISITTSDPLDTDSSYGWVNITCKVTDNVLVTQVYLNITNPNASFNNISMSPSGSDYYYSNTTGTFSQYGNYTYLIWSIDNDNNDVNSASNQFSLPPNYDINADGVINIMDLVLVSEVYGTSSQRNGWIRGDVNNNGMIQILDMVLISNNFGENWWV